MDHWRAPYLGLREIPPSLDDFELTTFFSFSAAELAAIRSLRKPLHRLALALQIGFLRMTGQTLSAFEQVPKELWTHLGLQLGVDAPEIGNLRSLYLGRPRTLADHQQLAYGCLGFQRITEHQQRYVVRWLRETMAGRADRRSLLPDLKRWFYEHRILLISDRELRSIIASVQISFESVQIGNLIQSYTVHKLDAWDRALVTPREADGVPLQTWLAAAPLKQSTVQMSQLFKKIEHLRTMGVADHWPEDVTDVTVRQYARRCANRSPSASKRVTSARRTLEVACFLRHALCVSSDELLTMLRRWIRKMANDAARNTEPSYTDAQTQLKELAQAVKALATQEGLSHEDLKAELCELASATLKDNKVSRTAVARTYLIDHPRQARAILARLQSLPLEAQGDHPVIEALALLRVLYVKKSNVLLQVPAIKLGRRWQEAIGNPDRAKALAAFEWATLFALRVALRNGSVYLAHSFSFRSQASLLISKEHWDVHRNTYYGHLKLSRDPAETFGPIVEHLEERLAEFDLAAQQGKVLVDSEGMHYERQPPSPEDLRVAELRRALMSTRPLGQLPEIALEVDSAVRFSWILLGREPHSRRELLMVYAAVLAHGTSMSAAEVSRMIPELTADAVRQTMKRLSDERRLRQASDAVVQYLHRFEIAKHWGRSDLASSDMMSLETERAIWQARADPRRKTASVGVYTHVRDGWGIIYDQPIVLNERQAGVALEGMVRQTAVENISQLAVDTHGYTDFAMALGKLLHCDLCPHLADIKHRQLHALKGYQSPISLAPILKCDIDISKCHDVYDDLVRVAASVHSGKCSAVQALIRFGSDARGQAIYDGGVQFGLLLRTIYLIDYLLNPRFRAEVRHALNRGESSHTLQRAIHSGKVPAQLSKRHESLAAVSSALSLLSNAVMAWNASHMQTALERIRQAGGTPLPGDMRRVAPTDIQGINLRGTFDFPIEKFAERIMPSSAQSTTPGRWRSA